MMKMKMKTIIFFMFLTSFCVGLESEKEERDKDHRKMDEDVPFYIANANFELRMNVPGDQKSLTAKQLYTFEHTASHFFTQIFFDKFNMDEEEYLFTEVNVMDLVKVSEEETLLKSTVRTAHAQEHVLLDFDEKLATAFDEAEVADFMDHLKDKGIMAEDSKIEEISFSEGEEDKSVYYIIGHVQSEAFEENEIKDLTGVVIGLTVALFMSISYILYLCLIRGAATVKEHIDLKNPDLKNPEIDVEFSATRTRTLGAEPREEEFLSPSPRKGALRRAVSTPVSYTTRDEMNPLSPSETTLGSIATEYTPNRVGGQPPLGITSMRKLQNYLTPAKNSDNSVPYDLTKASPA